MGDVYEGEGYGRKVAVKVLSIDVTDHDDALKRFRREAQTLTLFNHPNIVKLYDFGVSNGIYYARNRVKGKLFCEARIALG